MPDWSALDDAHLERVYAGLLGKITGVYLGRPVEGWSREHIVERFGEVDRYVADDLGVPLVVTDDDIAGTVTFVRALADHGFPTPLTPAAVGQTWLDRLVEGASVLWWGGRGISTEHTAYLNLTAGIPAPESGSAARNGVVAAEQIGAQIFVEGWAMICPGDPASAAELAGVAAHVSHDGVAVDAARFVAAMESAALTSAAVDITDVVEIIEVGLRFVTIGGPVDLLTRSLLAARVDLPDWRAARAALDRDWGYHRYGGDCPVLPNLGVVLLALLWGGLDLQRTLMIAVTCGWDTDCNAGTAGAVVGLACGLDAFDTAAGRPDWRSQVADRMLISTSDGGGAFTDALREARAIVDIARARRGLRPLRPPGSPRYDFALPGSVQGFRSPDVATVIDNVPVAGGRALRVRADGEVAQASVDVFVTGEDLGERHYLLLASPALYPGQLVRATVEAPPATDVELLVRFWGAGDILEELLGPAQSGGGGPLTLEFEIPGLDGLPIAGVGVRARSSAPNVECLLHDLSWSGPARALLAPPAGTAAAASTRWRQAWLHALDHPAPEPFGDTVPGFTLTQDRGRGLVSTGCDHWTDLRFTARLRTSGAHEFGVAVRVAGLRRYLALLVARDGTARLIRRHHDDETVLARTSTPVGTLGPERSAELVVDVHADRVRAWVDRTLVADLAVPGPPAGAVALLVDEGTVTVDAVDVAPTGSGEPSR